MLRIERLRIENWRNIALVDLTIPTATRLICLIGENGTGKSHLLEVVSAAAQVLGISPGLEIQRGDPFGSVHAIEVDVRFSITAGEFVNKEIRERQPEAWAAWDGLLSLRSRRDAVGISQTIHAGGIQDDAQSQAVGREIVHALQTRQETMYLYLDSDRSYPPKSINVNQYAEGLDRDWDAPQWGRSRAFRPTRDMYDEWMQFMLAREGQAATDFYSETRRASEGRGAAPVFEDPFASYKASVAKVMPHLAFAGADLGARTIRFDSAGSQLVFNQLSGGEREIAFLLGQIDRFHLSRGMMLLDEPELHLNADLVRDWVSHLRDSITEGQVWIATHSLEAVEVAGREATFVLERDAASRLVANAVPLSERPALELLSAAVGSPAFSLAKLRFVFIEGERHKKERGRFFRLTKDVADVRFIEAGGSNQVRASLSTVRTLAAEGGHNLRVAGVIDRDFHTDDELEETLGDGNIHVIGCHEVENILLSPQAVGSVLAAFGRDPEEAHKVVLTASDELAGAWILGRYCTREAVDITSGANELAYRSDWAAIEADPSAFAAGLLKALDTESKGTALRRVVEAVSEYRALRGSPDLWRECMGKEVLDRVAKAMPTASRTAYEDLVFSSWSRPGSDVPDIVTQLREFVERL